MITTVKYFAEKLNFPPDAIEQLLAQTAVLQSNGEASSVLKSAMKTVFATQDRSYEDLLEQVSAVSGVERYAVDMIFFLLCAPTMREYYEKKGVSETIYWDSLCDLRYKLIECKNLHGYYGSFTKNWFPRFLRAEAFALGRLQYECKPFPLESYGDLLHLDDMVCNCHIPSSGPLLFEDVIDSLKQAYDFYPNLRKNGILPVTCNSWLLYPPVAELFKKDSNMDRFYQLFEILSAKENPKNSDFWRIFSIPFTPENLQNAPQNSSLQASIKSYLLSGKYLGNGLGLILFDGERILTDRLPS